VPALSVRKWQAIVVTTGALLALGSTPDAAFASGLGGVTDPAGSTPPTPAPTGGTNPGTGTISASVGVHYDTSKNGTASPGASTGPLTPAGNWTPPACWYQPTYTPAQMKASSETVWAEDSPSQEWKNSQREYFLNGKPYTNFNLDKTGKGYFWSGYAPPANYGNPGASSCTDEPFWVDKGQPAPPGHHNAVTPDVLAELAYEQILIPQGTAQTNPGGTQTVNLPTWVWLDAATFHPVSVTAYLPDYGISATTTAKPISMHIDPGTPDAQLYPTTGDCPLDGDHIGTPYTPGTQSNPPCGVTYLHSTQNTGHPYQLTATITWQISWTGTGQPVPKALPAGAFGKPQDITVQEIQTINR
jgi:enoyl reductase